MILLNPSLKFRLLAETIMAVILNQNTESQKSTPCWSAKLRNRDQKARKITTKIIYRQRT